MAGVRPLSGNGGWMRWWRARLRKPAVEKELPESNLADSEEDAAIERERKRRTEDANHETQ